MTAKTFNRKVLAIGTVLLSLFALGCPYTNEPIAGTGGDSGMSGAGGSGGVSGTTETGGISGFVGNMGGGPSQGIDDGSSGITGRE